MTYRIYPYKVGSASVKKLKEALDGMIIKLENSRYRYRNGHTVINWGNSRRPSWMSNDVPVLNKPEAVAVASNKLTTFQKLSEEGVPTVEWTDIRTIAQQWLDEDNKVFVRQTLTGHSGDGITVLNPVLDGKKNSAVREALSDISAKLYEMGYVSSANQVVITISGLPSERTQEITVPEAPLYTKGIENTGEYRVHVFNGDVILYQKKSRRTDEDDNVITAEGKEADVRNLSSNWVYRTGNLNRLERIEQLAISAIEALGLDFGAVDIIKDQDGYVYVLEVNTAVGIGNSDTLDAYVTAFNNKLN